LWWSIRVTKNLLDDFVGNAEPMKIRSQSAPKRVPAVPRNLLRFECGPNHFTRQQTFGLLDGILLYLNLAFAPQRRGLSRAWKANALHGGGRRLSVRAVKAAGLAFIGAKRRVLTEEAGGSGAAFSQEGQ
jgi:hypothetical protein